MKITKLIGLLLLVVFMASCSSDGGGSSSGNSFTYKRNGTVVTVTDITAQISENTIAVMGDASNGQGIQFEFDKFGNLGVVTEYPSVDNLGDPWHQNHLNFSGHYFTFNMISYDEATHRVRVSFSGTLYENSGDLDSEDITVEGEFDVVCTVVTPSIPGLEVKCKIAGTQWYSSNSYTTNGNTMDDFILDEMNDDENMIRLGFDSFNNGPGTYNFTAATLTNFAHLSKFNTTTLDYVNYNCAGTLTVTSKTSLGIGMGYLIEGTYSFTATNPSNPADQIQVTEGHFKTNYLW